MQKVQAREHFRSAMLSSACLSSVMYSSSSESTQSVLSTCSVTVDKPPCCLAFSPENAELLVVGTYELLESEDKNKSLAADESQIPNRDGSLALYRTSSQSL